MSNFVEYIGGPRDGVLEEWFAGQLPAAITVVGVPEDVYARMFTGKDHPEPNTAIPTLTGTYRFARLHWSPLYPETQLGDYVWQGWQ